ncbi:MAG: hypothetical protein WD342_03780 [Verrucomicrobiales bacterium]
MASEIIDGGSYGSTVSFDADTREVLEKIDIRETSLAGQVYDAFEPVHYGTFGGLPVKSSGALEASLQEPSPSRVSHLEKQAPRSDELTEKPRDRSASLAGQALRLPHHPFLDPQRQLRLHDV